MLLVAASWARCLEETGSAAPRPRRTTGGGVPLPSSPREVPLKAPWGLSSPRGATPHLTHASAQLRAALRFFVAPCSALFRPAPPRPTHLASTRFSESRGTDRGSEGLDIIIHHRRHQMSSSS
ncbi:uncharacterized protein LOC123504902 [Portunus trituberculatus]|uniref:uncharacterized protein LOC123504902 n=1 Tax=Portunus trituberculatus TaxID=210409 RepID=UPI001E1D00C6|nr:uncharacterized protein LOC123504902 [Portunus trituberculatus]